MNVTYKKILVAYDGSEQSQLAFEQAKVLATLNDGNITVLQVVPSIKYYLYLPDSYLYADLSTRQKELLTYTHDYLTATFPSDDSQHISISVQEGSPKHTIVEYAENNHFDLILMGATGVHGVNKLVTGSTTTFVVSHASCPVLVVK
ncbi:universal stress protein [Vagococcus fluvialis]|uniref:universal stress protein n=1 Tax=Vagococcus fluvialis TaxID=2738 RepID=UPI003D0BAC49